MQENRTDWQISKHKLELFYGSSGSEQLRAKLVGLAEAGIMHINATLNRTLSGEVSTDELFTEDPSHDFNHAMRVLKLAENMAVIGGDIDVIRASVLFHDFVTYSKDAPGAKRETEEAASYAKDILESIDFPKEKIEKVLNIIIKTSFSKGLQLKGDEPYLTEAHIVYDADKLDQSGAMAIMRYFASGGQMPRDSHHPEDPFLKDSKRNPEVFKYTIDALVDRLPRIADSITMPSAKATAKQRNQFFDLFLKELRLELKELGGGLESEAGPVAGAKRIMKVFEDAGRGGKIFYSHDDPFCERRKPQLELYPLDVLIVDYRSLASQRPLDNGAKRRLEFMDNYFIELKYELEGEIIPPPRLQITREIWPGEEEELGVFPPKKW